jgi:hypothetical protein
MVIWVEAQALRQGDIEHAMEVWVETYADDRGVEKLQRFCLDGRKIEVAENIDQWHGADYRYFKVRGSDGDVYILRLDEVRAAWELTMYQRT